MLVELDAQSLVVAPSRRGKMSVTAAIRTDKGFRRVSNRLSSMSPRGDTREAQPPAGARKILPRPRRNRACDPNPARTRPCSRRSSPLLVRISLLPTSTPAPGMLAQLPSSARLKFRGGHRVAASSASCRSSLRPKRRAHSAQRRHGGECLHRARPIWLCRLCRPSRGPAVHPRGRPGACRRSTDSVIVVQAASAGGPLRPFA
jgi:hypothetical protein